MFGLNGSVGQWICFQPKLARDLIRIDGGFLPPRHFVADAMHFTMVDSTKWNGEFVTHLASEGARLGESQMMGVAGLAATY